MLDAILATGSVLGSIGGSIVDWVQGKEQREMDQAVNAKNEALMREAWAREDNSVQRRAADLKAAGINPLLAAGQAAQAGPATRFSNIASEKFKFDPDMLSKMQGVLQARQTEAGTTATIAQANLANTNAEMARKNQALQQELASYSKAKTAAEIQGLEASKLLVAAQAAKTSEEAVMASLDRSYYQKKKIHPGRQSSSQVGDVVKYGGAAIDAITEGVSDLWDNIFGK